MTGSWPAGVYQISTYTLIYVKLTSPVTSDGTYEIAYIQRPFLKNYKTFEMRNIQLVEKVTMNKKIKHHYPLNNNF